MEIFHFPPLPRTQTFYMKISICETASLPPRKVLGRFWSSHQKLLMGPEFDTTALSLYLSKLPLVRLSVAPSVLLRKVTSVCIYSAWKRITASDHGPLLWGSRWEIELKGNCFAHSVLSVRCDVKCVMRKKKRKETFSLWKLSQGKVCTEMLALSCTYVWINAETDIEAVCFSPVCSDPGLQDWVHVNLRGQWLPWRRRNQVKPHLCKGPPNTKNIRLINYIHIVKREIYSSRKV